MWRELGRTTGDAVEKLFWADIARASQRWGPEMRERSAILTVGIRSAGASGSYIFVIGTELRLRDRDCGRNFMSLLLCQMGVEFDTHVSIGYCRS